MDGSDKCNNSERGSHQGTHELERITSPEGADARNLWLQLHLSLTEGKFRTGT